MEEVTSVEGVLQWLLILVGLRLTQDSLLGHCAHYICKGKSVSLFHKSKTMDQDLSCGKILDLGNSSKCHVSDHRRSLVEEEVIPSATGRAHRVAEKRSGRQIILAWSQLTFGLLVWDNPCLYCLSHSKGHCCNLQLKSICAQPFPRMLNTVV